MTLWCAIKQDRRLKRDWGLGKVLEGRGMKISRKKMDYLCAGKVDALEKNIQLQNLSHSSTWNLLYKKMVARMLKLEERYKRNGTLGRK